MHSAHLVDIKWADVVDGKASPQVAVDYEVSRIGLTDRTVNYEVSRVRVRVKVRVRPLGFPQPGRPPPHQWICTRYDQNAFEMTQVA